MPIPPKLKAKLKPEWQKMPRSIWALGLVSLCMDTSSEIIHSLLPIFMVTTLGASVAWVGLIEGVAEALALTVKMFSGAMSDYLGRRKSLTLVGYTISAITKPLFPMAQGVLTVFYARSIDRIGKGIRGAPRDALIGDICPPDIRGAAFGLRQSLDTVGAFIGPLLAIALMWLFSNNIRGVMWFAVIPAYFAVILLIYGVKEPEVKHARAVRGRWRVRELKQVGKPYWQLVGLGATFMMARFSEAFLILRAQDVGLAVTYVPLVIVVMNVVYAATAYPAGKWSDQVPRTRLLIIGAWILIAADLLLAIGNMWFLMLGVALWGLHMGFTQGVLAAMVTDSVPEDMRGTAYGVYNLACGVALLFSSIIAGLAWDSIGPAATFIIGALFTGVAIQKLRDMTAPSSPPPQPEAPV